MAKKSGNGNGKGAGDILEAILREIQKTNTKLDAGFKDLGERIDGVNARLDNLIGTSGAKIREIEARLEALERKVG
jgi:hypothetical protein